MTSISIRSSFPKAPREPLSWDQMKPMAREAWRRGILVIRLEDLSNDWERQFAANVGEKLYGIAPQSPVKGSPSAVEGDGQPDSPTMVRSRW